MIDAAPMPPYPALLLQIFRDAKYMLDVRVAPLFGALVVTNEAWNKIEAADQADRAGRERKDIEKRLLGDAPKLDADSIATMKTRGLTVTTLDAEDRWPAFRAEAERLRDDDARHDGAGRRLRRGRSRARRVPQDQEVDDAAVARSRREHSSRRSPSAASCCCRSREIATRLLVSTGHSRRRRRSR